MKTVHAVSIALLLAIAAGLGSFAATRATTPSNAGQTGVTSAAVQVAQRSARLDLWQRQLRRASHRRPPKLPRLLHFPRVPAPAAPAPAVVSQVAVAPAPRTIYVHAKPRLTSATGHEHEGENERSGDGGGHDD